MSELRVCGTGGWGGPKPGDPDNNSILTAVPAFGGIDVMWTYPELNPHAVAHTLLFRSTSGTDANPPRHAVVSGNFFYDKTTTATPIEYFYWIQIVSVNGTVGKRIGPASATARPTISQVMEQLTAQIDAGHLAQSLKADIARITSNEDRLNQEILDRIAALTSLGQQLNGLQDRQLELHELIAYETDHRLQADRDLVDTLNRNYAALDEERDERITALQQEIEDRRAALLSEAEAREAAIAAEVAARIEAVQAERDARVAALEAEQGLRGAAIAQERQERVEEDAALATALESLTAIVNGAVADIAAERTVRADADEALASDLLALQTEVGDAQTAILTEQEARSSEYAAMAKAQQAISAAFSANSASLFTLEQLRADDKEVVASRLTSLSAGMENNRALILQEQTVRSDAVSSLATEISVLSAKLDAMPTYANGFEAGLEFERWEVAPDNTLTATTTEVFAGEQAALATSTAASPGGAGEDLIRIRIPSATSQALSSFRVRISLAVRQPEAAPAAEMALAYVCAGMAFSGWSRFTPGETWSVVDFQFDIPEDAGGVAHYLVLWADTSGQGLGVEVDRLQIQVAEAEIQDVTAAIAEEREARVTALEAVASEFSTMESRFEASEAAMAQEASTRASEDLALARRINTLQASVNYNAAAITEESQLRVDAVSAVVETLSATQAELEDTQAALTTETQVRVSADEALGERLDSLTVELEDTQASLVSESQARADGDSALATQIDLVSASVDDVEAALVSESQARADADGALASDIEVLVASVDDNAASIRQEAEVRSREDQVLAALQSFMSAAYGTSSGIKQTREQIRLQDNAAFAESISLLGVELNETAALIAQEQTVRAGETEALARDMTALVAEVGDNASAILSERKARTTAIEAVASDMTALEARLNDEVIAAIQTESQARVTADQALAAQIAQAESALGDDLAQVQVAMGTEITRVDGELQNIGALYTAKVNVNGLIGGFGVYNDGSTVEAGFDVDRFWVGRTSSNKRKPFIIQNNETFIDEAVIRQLTFDKLRAADGSLIVANGKVRATYLDADNLVAQQAQSPNFAAGSTGWRLRSNGNAEFNSGTFRGNLSAAGGTFSGSLSAAGGTFSGTLTANAINAVNTINIAGNAVTIPIGAYSAGEVRAVNTTEWYRVISATINSSGAPIQLHFSGNVHIRNETTVIVRIRENGNLIYEAETGQNGTFVSVLLQRNPGAGSNTYEAFITKTVVGGSYVGAMSNRCILLLEVKK